MSWQATAYVSELTRCPNGEPLTRSEKLLALLLANRHNPDFDIAWPSIPRLAEEALLSERRTRDLVHSLERKGVITIERRWKGPQQCDNNVYRFPGLVRRGGGAISSPPRPRSFPRGGAIAIAPEPSLNRNRTDSEMSNDEEIEDWKRRYDALGLGH